MVKISYVLLALSILIVCYSAALEKPSASERNIIQFNQEVDSIQVNYGTEASIDYCLEIINNTDAQSAEYRASVMKIYELEK